MDKSVSRRNFLLNGINLGIGASFLSKLRLTKLSQTGKGSKPPFILSSGGHGFKANEEGWKVLGKGGSSLDAVEKGANVIESDAEDISVGLGGLPNEDGVVQLDASIMYGPDHNAGSVAALECIENPCSVARRVMERTDHIMLVGEGAMKFALAHGFKKTNLLTDKAREIWLRWKETLSDKDDWFPPKDWKGDLSENYGTINVLAMDAQGNISGVTTTSGLAFKIPGRVGDSPIIGDGLYLDNDIGAAGATGRGEEVIRTCGSYRIVENMRRGLSPEEACKEALEFIIKKNKGEHDFNVSLLAFNRDGEFGSYSVWDGYKFAFCNEEGNKAYEGKYLYKRPSRK
jgi:N4-(beta-N-acetylglucosaminyl)-L-asparaginase